MDFMLDHLNSSVADDGNPSPVVLLCESTQLCGSVSRTMIYDLELHFQQTMNDKVFADKCNLLESESLSRLSELLQKLKSVVRGI